MFLRCYNYVQVTQVPTEAYPNRNSNIMVTELVKYDVSDGWESLTTTAKVCIPKQTEARDFDTDQPITIQGSNINIGGSINPLFMRGDKISIYAGYWYEDELWVEQQYVKLLFNGYISKVTSKLNIDLDCEDYMWLLKQIPVPNKSWGNISLQAIIQQVWADNKAVKAAGLTVASQSQSKFTFDNGTLTTNNVSLAQMLAKLKQEVGIPAYFRDEVLRIWYPVYYGTDVTPNAYQFIFQQNIISDNLTYQRKEDVVMSAVGTNMLSYETTEVTKDGQAQTRKKQMKVYAWCDQKTQSIKTKVITDDTQIPPNTEGQRFDFKFADCKNETELANRVASQLTRAYYTGFKGEFTTYGMPYIRFGDNIQLVDNVIKDRNGTYKVKKVEYSGGFGLGVRQKIHLDYLIQ